MKRHFFLVSLLSLVLLGAGCRATPSPLPPPEETVTYQNEEFGFALDYPVSTDMWDRPDGVRINAYLGVDMDLFASLRDHDAKRSGQEVFTALLLYAVKDMDIDGFVQALEASDPGMRITGRRVLSIHSIEVTELINATPVDIDKYHYLFFREGTLIIFSPALRYNTYLEPVIQSLRPLEG